MLPIALAVSSAPAAVRYVNVNNAGPSSPYITWETAAINIQDAVDVAVDGDEIAVTNGIYQAGEKIWPPGLETNRLAITKPLRVYSVNGSSVTVIDGGGAIRCVYLAADTTLTGFTLTNGFAIKGGGLYCESNSAAVSDCVLTRNFVGGYGSPVGAVAAGAYGGTLTKCTLTLNTARISAGGGAAYATLNNCLLSTNYGSGAYQCTLNDCILVGNSSGANFADAGGGALQCTLNNCSLLNNYSYYGGGAADCTLNDCSLKKNWADNHGGGAVGGTLNNCIITDNMSEYGGGANGVILNNCTISNNVATDFGGGTASCTVNNCLLIDNLAFGSIYTGFGGGDAWSTLNNCTLAGNEAGHGAGGGAFDATLNNCIVYFNTAPQDPNYDSSCALNYSCATPMPTNGVGNFTNEPSFVNLAIGNLRLQSNSPCINAGNNDYVTTSTDLDGNPRIAGRAVDMGAFEFVLTPQLHPPELNGDNCCVSFETACEWTYFIEYKNSLVDPVWNPYKAVVGDGNVFTITNCISDAPQRFYRLRVN